MLAYFYTSKRESFFLITTSRSSSSVDLRASNMKLEIDQARKSERKGLLQWL